MKLAPWLVLLLAIAVNVVSYVLVAFDAMSLGETGIATVTLVIGFVGALVASKRGGNGIGWVFLLLCLSLAVNSFAVGYAEAAEDRPDLPGAPNAAAGLITVFAPVGSYIPGMRLARCISSRAFSTVWPSWRASTSILRW